MDQAIFLFFEFFSRLFGLLNSVSFTLFGLTVSYLDLILGGLVFVMLVLVVWRGAKA